MDKTDAIMIVALARSNMNVSEAAKRAYFHRNSFEYHINKIKRVTGLDPHNFFDLGELYSMACEILGDESVEI